MAQELSTFFLWWPCIVVCPLLPVAAVHVLLSLVLLLTRCDVTGLCFYLPGRACHVGSDRGLVHLLIGPNAYFDQA